jgi:hypothetical protein
VPPRLFAAIRVPDVRSILEALKHPYMAKGFLGMSLVFSAKRGSIMYYINESNINQLNKYVGPRWSPGL